MLWLLLPGARRGWTWRTLLIGLAYAATMILFVLANKTTTAANAIFLQSTAPLYLLLLGPLVLHEPIRRSDVAVISVVAVGAILLLRGSPATASTAPNPALGNLFASIAGITWALTMAGFRWLVRDRNANSANATVIAGNLIAFLVCLPGALPITHATILDVTVLLYIGVFQISLAYICLTRSLREVPALEAATLLLVEPVLNPVWTWIVHGERPGAPALVGGFLIIAAAFLGTAWQVRRSALRYVG